MPQVLGPSKEFFVHESSPRFLAHHLLRLLVEDGEKSNSLVTTNKEIGKQLQCECLGELCVDPKAPSFQIV